MSTTTASSSIMKSDLSIELNKRLVHEVEQMRRGLVDLIGIASSSTEDTYATTLNAFHSNVKSTSIIRSAHSLLALTNLLKLLHLFNHQPSLTDPAAAVAATTTTREELHQQIIELLNANS